MEANELEADGSEHNENSFCDICEVDMEIYWTLSKPCSSSDFGTQRCRLPPQLFQTLDVSIGSYVIIDFGTLKVICSVWIWKEQQARCLQCDETVTYSNKTECAPRSSFLSSTAFRSVEVETLKAVTVTLVFRSHSSLIANANSGCDTVKVVREILSSFVIRSHCKVSCKNISVLAKLLRVTSIVVEECDLGPFVVGRVTAETRITIARCISEERYEVESKSGETVPLGGLETQKRTLKEFLTCPQRDNDTIRKLGVTCPKGILLIGPPGTGKTCLVKVVAGECRAQIVCLDVSSVHRSNPGDSEAVLRNALQRARNCSREGTCVLFIDEIDGFLSRTSNQSNCSSERLLSQLFTVLDAVHAENNLFVVGATNRPNVLDSSLRRPGRFDQELYMGIPTQSEREDILKTLTANMPLCVNFNFERVCEWMPGYVGADLALVCKLVTMSRIASSPLAENCQDKKIYITEEQFSKVILSFQPSTLRGSSVSDFSPIQWDDIGGLEDVKLQIKQAVEWPLKHSDVFQRLGVRKPRGILLYGPPGCCKSTLVRAAATASNVTLLSVGAAHVYSPYVGDSEKALSEFFRQGRLAAPAILFLDEIDSLLGNRNSETHSGIQEKVLSTVLNEMDGIGLARDLLKGTTSDGSNSREMCEQDIVTVAATNRPDLLDEALLRPGRFDRVIYVPPPDANARRQILNTLLKKMPAIDVDIDYLVRSTHNFSGADLENLCREAGLLALTEDGPDAASVNNSYFVRALKEVKPSITDTQLQFYESIRNRHNV